MENYLFHGGKALEKLFLWKISKSLPMYLVTLSNPFQNVFHKVFQDFFCGKMGFPHRKNKTNGKSIREKIILD
jgi:hypothetical protein